MKIKLLIFFLTIVSIHYSSAQYKVSEIPEELKSNAQLVVRKSDYVFTVHSESAGKIEVKQVVTVLSSHGNDEANFYLDYDANRKVTSLSAKFYDASGKVFEKFKKTDFRDVKYGDGASLYNDSRLLYLRPKSPSYPYTIEYEFTIETEKLLFYPTWVPVDDEKISLQEGSFKVIVPKGHTFRYRTRNMEGAEPSISVEGNNDVYEWRLSHLKPVEYEPVSRGFADAFPVLYTAPNKFSYEGYEGSFKTWDDYAKWYREVNDERDQLSEEYRSKVLSLVADLDSDLEKTQKIYEYLQENTRYVGIQLGIGGFQSFPADVTADNGYGDCKALTTYTKGMLEVAGIPSYYVLVRAGRRGVPIQSDFPSQQFNHVFLAVPIEKDTVWLECTSQTNPFGYLGTFTGDREVLVINEEGGKIVRTPKFPANVNLQSRTAVVSLSENGDATAEISTTYSGEQYENNGLPFHIRESSAEQKKWLYNRIDIGSFEIIDFSFEEKKDRVPSIDEYLNLNMRKFASISGKRIFIKPNLMNQFSYMPPEDEERKSDVLIKRGWTDIDSITYLVPEGLYVESQPIEKTIESDFGTYEVRIIQDTPGEILYVRKMVRFSGNYPASSYPELRGFLKQVIRMDKKKLVFAKKT